MEKLILKDGTELEIKDGASVNSIELEVADYAALGTLAAKLTKENVSEVKFQSDGQVTGEYSGMVLQEPHFRVTQKSDFLSVLLGIREMTLEEQQQEDVATAISYLTDEQAVSVTALYPEWESGKAYKTGDRKRYNGELYKCLQNHTSQDDWTPNTAPSLWAKILPGQSGEIGEWVQPDSTNPYMKGDKVTHNGNTWESLVDNNVWEPGAVGTESLWKKVSQEESE